VKSLSALLNGFPNVAVRIDGHTEKTIDQAADQRISLERANAVKALIVKAGIPADRIGAEGFGSEKPIAPNDSEENRAKNRRIELTIVRK
jgi:outer membrane protein OmpA-like peptidoglycan-associated protein